jgi:hypothetical protein
VTRFSSAEAAKVSGNLSVALQRMQARKTQYDQLPEPQKTANAAAAMLLDQQIATAQTALVQLADLQTHYEVIGDSCRIGLRVFHVAGETKPIPPPRPRPSTASRGIAWFPAACDTVSLLSSNAAPREFAVRRLRLVRRTIVLTHRSRFVCIQHSAPP